MPHIIIEYSKNLESSIDVDQLLNKVHERALKISALPLGGIRIRVVKHSQYKIADGDSDYGFIYVSIWLGQGRTAEIKQEIGRKIFSVVTDFTAEYFDAHPLSLGLEIREIQSEFTHKKNNLHQYVKDRK